VLPEKDRGKEELSAGGKGSPRAYQGNGAARHFHADERLPAPHPYPGTQDCVEAAVCHVKDLENGQMREVELGWGKVLLLKDNGEFHALGHKCPHYGAPLVKGVLSRGRVRCPWHGACFSVSSGDLEDFPGLDSLHKFQVKIEKEKVYVRASKQALQLQRRTKVMATCISPSAGHSGSTNVLIVGAGWWWVLGGRMFENNRVKFYMQTEVSELRAQEGKLKEVVLKSSKVVRADVCVVGIGASQRASQRWYVRSDGRHRGLWGSTQRGRAVKAWAGLGCCEHSGPVLPGAVPATGFLRQSGISLDSRGFIPVNKMMQTNIPGVFAAGDAVTFPLAWRNSRKVNIPHWQMAHAQGTVSPEAAGGYGEGFDDVIIQGDLDELKFVAFYTKTGVAAGQSSGSATSPCRGDEVISVASMNYDPIVSKVAEVLASGRTIRKREVE
ncbi:AIFM3, partial [Cervus elaphus hippelaphus]